MCPVSEESYFRGVLIEGFHCSGNTSLQVKLSVMDKIIHPII